MNQHHKPTTRADINTDILITIDDTDNRESIGTGHLANQLSFDIEQKNWGTCARITRHQLFVHDDIPYTSHNSAMCFAARILPDKFDPIVEYAADFLIKNSAPGSDPGLCMVKLTESLDKNALIAFGQSARKKVLSKDDAYRTASKLNIHLSEHGGTGDGVVGALAGAGLRLNGNDGRFRGWFAIEAPESIATVEAICTHEWVDQLQSIEGEFPGAKDSVLMVPEIKTVLLNHKSTILIKKSTPSETHATWQMVPRDYLKENKF